MTQRTYLAEIQVPEVAGGALPHSNIFYVAIDMERPVQEDLLIPVLTQHGCLVLSDAFRSAQCVHLFKVTTYADAEFVRGLLKRALGQISRYIAIAWTAEVALVALESVRREVADLENRDVGVRDAIELLQDESVLKAIAEAGD